MFRSPGALTAACVALTVALPRHAIAHGQPASVTGIVAADARGPRVVALSEGLAALVDSEWRFVCPAAFGSQIPPPALSADGERTYVVGANDLFALEPDGRVVGLGRPELSRESVVSLVATEARPFATRYVSGFTELWSVDDPSKSAIWRGSGVHAAFSSGGSGLWLVNTTGASARALLVTVDGTLVAERSFAVDAFSSVSSLLSITGALYVTVLTATLGSELLLVDETEGGGISSVHSLMQTSSLISGPVSDGAGGAWIASEGNLSHLSGAEIERSRSGERFAGLGTYRATSYASLFTRLVELGQSGPGGELFALAQVREPLLDTVTDDARDECNAQWMVFRHDLTQAGVFLDAGLAAARSSGPPSASAASGGCAIASTLRPHGESGALATLSLVSVLFASRGRTRPHDRRRRP